MLKWRVFDVDQAVEVWLGVDNPNGSDVIQYKGPKDSVELVKRDLENSGGLYGHLIGEMTTPIDLEAAMLSEQMALYAPELIEGQDILDAYENDIPEDAFT